MKIVKLKQTCSACPSQWDGEMDNGTYFYARYRWGILRVEVNHVVVLDKSLGDGLDGFLSTGDLEGELTTVGITVEQGALECE